MLNIELVCDPTTLLKRNEDIYSHKNMYTNVYSSIVHNSPMVATSQKFINGWINKM